MPPAAQVTLRRSGKTFAVNCDEVILETALRQEIWLPHACRGGTCGSCRATIVAGAVTYDRDSPLRVQQANSEVYLFCAKPLGDIVLDLAELAARPIGAMLRRPARVVAIVKPSRDVAIVTLKPPPNAAIRFRCGQYISLVGDDGRLHPFSIANAPRPDGTLELHIGHIPDGLFTTQVHDRTRPGDIFRFEGPFGEFGFSDSVKRPAILVAGGTGIAPIKAMLESLAPAKPGDTRYLYWGSRRAEGLYAIRELSTLTGVRLTTVLSEPAEEASWSGRVGLVHRAVIDDFPDLSRFDVYVCGSPGLIDRAFCDFTQVAGLPPSRFFADAFSHARTVSRIASAAR